MAELIKVAVDAHGGDNAPTEVVKGVVMALNELDNLKVYLVGMEDIINKELEGKTYDKDRLEIVNATEIIQMAEPPVAAIRRKKILL